MQYRAVQEEFWSLDKSGRRPPEHPVVRAVYEPMAQFAASAVAAPAQSKVLDVGCGNGFLQHFLEKSFGYVLGLDYSSAMLEHNPSKNLVQGDCQKLPFPDGSFDVVCASHMLHHLTEAERHTALSEMKRVATKALIVFEPNRNNPLTFIFALSKKEEREAIHFSRTYLKELLKSVGVEAQVQADGWIVPNKSPLWSVRLGQRLNTSLLKCFGFDLWAKALL